MGTGKCAQCRQPFSTGDHGRKPLYCSPACRSAAYRARKRGVFTPSGPVHVSSEQLAAEAQDLVRRSGSPTQRAAELLLQASVMVAASRRLARELPPALAWRFTLLGDRLTAAIEEMDLPG